MSHLLVKKSSSTIRIKRTFWDQLIWYVTSDVPNNRREQISTTMSAKSLGTLTVIYAIDELQNPLPRKTMLFEGHMTSTFGRSDACPNSLGPWLLIQHCMRGGGGLHSHY